MCAYQKSSSITKGSLAEIVDHTSRFDGLIIRQTLQQPYIEDRDLQISRQFEMLNRSPATIPYLMSRECDQHMSIACHRVLHGIVS